MPGRPPRRYGWNASRLSESPAPTGFDLSCEDASVDIAGLDAFVHVDNASGSIRVRDAREVSLVAASRSIDVVADHGLVHTGPGSIRMVLAGEVDAHAEGGSMTGRSVAAARSLPAPDRSTSRSRLRSIAISRSPPRRGDR